jgi:prophage regulatory protein
MKNTQFKSNSDFPRVERHKRSADTTFIKTTTEKYMTTRKLIRLPEVMNKTGFSKAWIYRLISKGDFPKPIKIGIRASAFVESEIDEWIEQLIYSSRNTAA